MVKTKTLQEWRQEIKREVRFVGIKPYSHNIINISLEAIASKFGRDEANKAIQDFGLEKLGWKQIKEG